MQTSVIEYMGELLSDGHLSVPSDVFSLIEPGQKLKVRIEPCDVETKVIPNEHSSLSADEFLNHARVVAITGGYAVETITREFIHDRDS